MRYTAKNGTTFQFNEHQTHVSVITPHDEEVGLDLDDLREFLEHLEQQADGPTDADATAVSSD